MSDQIELSGRVLSRGEVSAEAVFLTEPLSFWGGYDPATGKVIDQQHPQVGSCISGKILVMPGTRGSSGTPGVLAESLRLKTGPLGIILCKADINVTAATLVVATLYDLYCPVIQLSVGDFDKLDTKRSIEIKADGVIVQ